VSAPDAAPFTAALGLTAVADGFGAVLADRWTVGPKAHGGLLLALCAKAARCGLGVAGVQPLVVSASYLGAPEPGEVQLVVDVRKRGRTVSVVDVELRQGARTAVHAVVTLGAPDDTEPLHVRRSDADAMTAEPASDAIDVGTHPIGRVMHLSSVCDLRLDRATAAFADARVDGEAELRLWVRPRGQDPDALFALMASDVSPPVILNLGRSGWAPTVQLTALLRAEPAPGWLRVQTSSRCVGARWFDEEAVVTDSTGALVCQSRQLAVMPTGS